MVCYVLCAGSNCAGSLFTGLDNEFTGLVMAFQKFGPQLCFQNCSQLSCVWNLGFNVEVYDDVASVEEIHQICKL
jgi:hypothetical protein